MSDYFQLGASMFKATLAIGAMMASSIVFAANTQMQIKTTLGDIEIELFNDKAPITSKNFETYVKAKFYNGTIFHRVIPGFMVQGGGMNEQMVEKENRPSIKNEAYNGLKNIRGSLAMARTNDPDSASSQFFINLADNDFLNKTSGNPGYAVFGKVNKGMEIVDSLSRVPTGRYGMHQDVPKTPIKIISIDIKNSAKK